MPTLVACESCGKKMKLPEGTTAKRVRCPGCGEIVSVSATGITSTPPPSPRKEKKLPRPDPEGVVVDVEVAGREEPDDDEEPRVRKKKKRRRKSKEKEKRPADEIPLWLWGALAGAALVLFIIVSAVFIHAGYGMQLLAFLIGMAILLPISVVILVISMFAASAVLGGVDFGQAHVAIPKAAALLFVVNLLMMIPFIGPFITAPVWFLGLMGLFGLDWVEARVLVIINWGLNFVVRIFVLGAIVSALMHTGGDGGRPIRGGPGDRPAAVQQDEADEAEEAPPLKAPPRPWQPPR